MNKNYGKPYGVYKIVNLINNDFYIGSTTESFDKRWCKHKSDFKNNRRNTLLLSKAFIKYGFENFKMIPVYTFVNRRDSIKEKQIVTFLEEKLIMRLNPYYNICQKPTRGGCPNLGRKLSQEWKDNISKKSEQYKHSKETLIKVSNNNKNNSCKYKITTVDGKIFIGAMKECANHFNIDESTIYNYYNKKYNSKYISKIEKLKSQKKKIILIKDNFKKEFISFSECDKFLNMWRGFTSTQVVKNRKLIFDYNYVIEDIV